jgi:hypothetical protein
MSGETTTLRPSSGGPGNAISPSYWEGVTRQVPVGTRSGSAHRLGARDTFLAGTAHPGHPKARPGR